MNIGRTVILHDIVVCFFHRDVFQTGADDTSGQQREEAAELSQEEPLVSLKRVERTMELFPEFSV